MSQVEFRPVQQLESFVFSPGHLEMIQGVHPDSNIKSFYTPDELSRMCFNERGEIVPDALKVVSLEVANTAIPAWADFASNPTDLEAQETLGRETNQVALGLQVAAEVVQRHPEMVHSEAILRIVGVAAGSKEHLDPQSVQIIEEISHLLEI